MIPGETSEYREVSVAAQNTSSVFSGTWWGAQHGRDRETRRQLRGVDRRVMQEGSRDGSGGGERDSMDSYFTEDSQSEVEESSSFTRVNILLTLLAKL